MANDYETLECQSPVERTWGIPDPQASSPNKVTCMLPPRGTDLGSSTYTITMYVDSKKVPNTKTVKFDSGRTPELEHVDGNRYVKVGDMVTFGGTIFTKRFGNAGVQGDGSVANEDAISLLNVFMGPPPDDDEGLNRQQCEMVTRQKRMHAKENFECLTYLLDQ